MAIYNLDNIIDTIVEASNPAAPTGLQILDAFKALKPNVKVEVLSGFIEGIEKIVLFLKTSAQEGMRQFFKMYQDSGGKLPSEIYTTPGPIKDAMHALCDDTEGLTTYLQSYGKYFNIQAIDVDVNSLKGLLRKATDPEGRRDKKAYEQAFSDTAAYNAAMNEAFVNNPVNKMLMDIRDAYHKLRSDLINMASTANSALSSLNNNVIQQGKEAVSQGVKIGGRAAQLAIKDIGDVVKPFDPRLGNSPADAVRARQKEQAGDYFQNAPAEPARPNKFKPMTPKQHEAYLAAQAARGNYTESLVYQVANLITEDPDIIIS